MNRYTVVWWPAALDELAKLWLLDRAAVAAASDEADRRLAENPTKWGDEVAPGIDAWKPQAFAFISTSRHRIGSFPSTWSLPSAAALSNVRMR